jgi:hypothetical protein
LDAQLARYTTRHSRHQNALEADPQRFFRPQPSGSGVFADWLGVVLSAPPPGGVDWDEVAAIVEETFRMVAPRRLLAELDDH